MAQAMNHPSDTYRMLNLLTHRLIKTRDVRWLEMVYGHYHKLTSEELDTMDFDLQDHADHESCGGI